MKKKLEKKLVLLVFLALEIILVIIMIYKAVKGEFQLKLGYEQLIILGFLLGFIYIMYVELRAKKFSEYLVDEKIKTHALVDALPTGIIIVDQDNKIITANSKATKLIEIDLFDMINKELGKFVHFDKSFAKSGAIGKIEGFSAPSEKKISLNFIPLKRGKLIIIEEVKEEETRELKKVRAELPGFVKFLFEEVSRLYLPEQTLRPSAGLFICSRKLVNYFKELQSLPQVITSKERINMADLVEQSLHGLKGLTLAKGLKLDLEKEGNLVINANKELLFQAIDELIFNACSYTPENGRIIIKLSSSDSEAQMQIIDNGVGIIQDELYKIFEYGFVGSRQLPETTGGKGAGLFFVRKIIELHGGSIWVESKPDAGSRFTFTIPG
jgi:signal transduction histidine kinase